MQRGILIVAALFTVHHFSIAQACCTGYKIPPPYAKPFRPQAFSSLPKVTDIPFERLRQLPHLEHYHAEHEPLSLSVTYYPFDNICLSNGEYTQSTIIHYKTTQRFLSKAPKHVVGKYLYCYSAWWLQHRWPDAERYIQGTPYAKPYVENVLNAKWPTDKGLLTTEPTPVAKVNNRLNAAEEAALLKDGHGADKLEYAIQVRGEWPAYEQQMLHYMEEGNHVLPWIRDYWRMVKRKPWPELEKQIIANLSTTEPSQLYGFYHEMEMVSYYMRDVRRGVWPELQEWISKLENGEREQYYYDLGVQQP